MFLKKCLFFRMNGPLALCCSKNYACSECKNSFFLGLDELWIIFSKGSWVMILSRIERKWVRGVDRIGNPCELYVFYFSWKFANNFPISMHELGSFEFFIFVRITLDTERGLLWHRSGFANYHLVDNHGISMHRNRSK